MIKKRSGNSTLFIWERLIPTPPRLPDWRLSCLPLTLILGKHFLRQCHPMQWFSIKKEFFKCFKKLLCNQKILNWEKLNQNRPRLLIILVKGMETAWTQIRNILLVKSRNLNKKRNINILNFMHIAGTLEARNRPQGEKGEYFMAVLDENRASLKSRPPQRETG